MIGNRQCGCWKLSLALALTASLSACSEGQRAVSRDEATDIADDAVDASGLEDRVSALEERLEKSEADVASLRKFALANYASTESLRGTFNHNVDLRNKEKVADMTRRGACGQRMFSPPRQNEDGTITLAENIPCTEADLLP